jgi:hypothetical protein
MAEERHSNGFEQRLLFREVNDRIRDVSVGFAIPVDSYEVLCECGRNGCLERIEVPIPMYDEIRGDRLRFLVRPGHELRELEDVVAEGGTYRVVSPTGGGLIA